MIRWCWSRRLWVRNVGNRRKERIAVGEHIVELQ